MAKKSYYIQSGHTQHKKNWPTVLALPIGRPTAWRIGAKRQWADGGRRLLRIRDDGCGMDRDNALLSLERHATSKLRALSDLDTIATMGFRGEALAAISAVSQFTMVTQRAGDPAGTEILVHGGAIQELVES